MKSIILKNITIQFDFDKNSPLTAQQQAESVIEQINLTLQREPYGLAAQIISGVNESDVQVQDNEQDGLNDDFDEMERNFNRDL